MAKVRIFLKGWRDGRLYTDAVNFASHPLHEDASELHKRSFKAYQPGDPTYWAITYGAEGTDTEICNRAYELFNVGENNLARIYRERGHRSLSVGDVIVIDTRAYTLASMGFESVDFERTRYARYAWQITEDYTVSCTEVEPSRHRFTNPPRFKTVLVSGPRNMHPNAMSRLAVGEGQRFELFDDDGILYYRGRWFEDVTKLDDVDQHDIEPADFEGSPLDDYGTPNAGAVVMTVDIDRKPYMG